MEDNIESKIELKSKLINFLNLNKFKIIIFFSILILSIFSLLFINLMERKKNVLIAEKYVEAGLLLAANQKDDSLKLFEEIILSKNKFYSILSLNTILEKNLVTDKIKILNYFKTLEKLKFSSETSDLITLKKALYYLKVADMEIGNDLIKKLIENKSSLKSIAEEIIIK